MIAIFAAIAALNVFMLSVHGLIRSDRPELGRDADTGGQVQYVLDLARALGRHEMVEEVTLVTRLVEDPDVGDDYANPLEILGESAQLVRLPFGPRRYIRKEALWPHLDQMVDQCLAWMREQPRLPDVIHSHYADAGYVGEQLSLLLGIPLISTAHSLGREKRARLLESGRKEQTIDREFNFARRIRAEEQTLEHASMIVASTRQEQNTQYATYENFVAPRSVVIAPGVNLERFKPARAWSMLKPGTYSLFEKFLRSPRKPIILALCRPDTRKNISGLINAYASSDELRRIANLAIIAGNRDDIRSSDDEAQKFFTELLLDIDHYDLFGQVAIPKHHEPEQVPEIYRYVARTRGVLVNPSLNENFGLTLIEAAASGLPVVATDQGGPTEIVANCRNGLLIDPLDTERLGTEILSALSDKDRWRRWAANGVRNASRFYSWEAHANTYVRSISKMVAKNAKASRGSRAREHIRKPTRTTLAHTKFLLIADLDSTFVGDPAAMRELLIWLRQRSDHISFGVASGRTMESALSLLRLHNVPTPDVVLSSVGSEIRYGSRLILDNAWQDHIQYFWRRDDVLLALASIPQLTLQPQGHQSNFKVSYNIDPENPVTTETVSAVLKSHRLRANLIFSHGKFLDVLPIRASKGRAIRYLAYKWGLNLRDLLVAGDSGNDFDMLIGETLGVVVGDYAPELEVLRRREHVFFAPSPCARGIIEGIAEYGFGEQHDLVPSTLLSAL
jgi:sucrose-phosphate synthase